MNLVFSFENELYFVTGSNFQLLGGWQAKFMHLKRHNIKSECYSYYFQLAFCRVYSPRSLYLSTHLNVLHNKFLHWRCTQWYSSSGTVVLANTYSANNMRAISMRYVILLKLICACLYFQNCFIFSIIQLHQFKICCIMKYSLL